MLDKEWLDYFRGELASAQRELADFKEAVAKYRLPVRHIDANGEKDMTEANLHVLEEAVREYQSIVDRESKGRL